MLISESSCKPKAVQTYVERLPEHSLWELDVSYTYPPGCV
jgi:hypothetical protein